MEDEVDEDGVAGPELPPDFEEEVADDDEGRFFGGGITHDTAEVLDFIDERDQDDIVSPGHNMERKITADMDVSETRED